MKQTEEIFKNGYITSRGKIAKANGTAHAQGTVSDGFIEAREKKRKKEDEDGRNTNPIKGTAWASGTAYAKTNSKFKKYDYNKNNKKKKKKNSGKSSKTKNKNKNKNKNKKSSSNFKEVFDWIEIKIEEINEDLDLMSAKLENAIDLTNGANTGKNNLIDQMIQTNRDELKALKDGAAKYDSYAEKILQAKNSKGKYIVPTKYWNAARNGKISIETFKGKTDEKALEKIKEYREWAQKAADAYKKMEEVQKELSNLGKQKFDTTFEYYDVRTNIEKLQNDKLQAAVDYDEESGKITSGKYYEAMAKNALEQIQYLTKARKDMQAVLDEQVKAGNVKKYDNNWFEMVNQMYEVDAAIDECNKSLEEFQNSINDIYWGNFDKLIERLENISGETDNVINLMGNIEEAVVTPKTESGWSADDVEWTKEGIVQLGLYAQQMENSRFRAKEYEKAINELNAQYKAGRYSESEYLEKLNDLKNAQYDAIDADYAAQDAIKALHEARVDEIKNGIDKEISALEKLTEKRKEELSAQKDLFDFQKNVKAQRKDIATIERKLAALSADNSASAMAKRRKLEAELQQAKQELEDTYYDRSIENQQNALDKNLETFQNEKDKEIEKWEEYLENTKQLLTDTLDFVQLNSINIYDTLQEKSKEYGLTLSEQLINPWKNGESAISDYQTTFDQTISATMDKLNEMKSAWQATIDATNNSATEEISNQNQENVRYEQASYVAPPASTPAPTTSSTSTSTSTSKKTYPYGKASSTKGNIKKGSKGNSVKAIQWALKQMGYFSGPVGGKFGSGTEKAVKKFQKANKLTADGVVGSKTRKKFKAKGYALGSKYIPKDQLALIDELGPELQLVPNAQGRLEYIKKGTGIVPADATANLMEWGKIDPTSMLEQNRPTVGVSPSIHSTEVNLNIQYGDILKIENFNGDNPEDIAKVVAKQFEKHTAQLNQSLRRYVR